MNAPPDTARLQSRASLRWVALRTPTLPPATHTNCYILGQGKLTVVDPGSPDVDEQACLLAILKHLEAEGHSVERILLTHHHEDHISGAAALASALGAPIWAHARTRERLERQVPITRVLHGGETLTDRTHTPLHVLHTPGHAPGHLALWHPASHTLICGDLMASQGTIIINPPEGHMGDYLRSLHAVDALAPQTLLCAHGAPVLNARDHIAHYINHRLAREARVLDALASGEALHTPQIVASAYAELNAAFWPLAERSTLAHLIKLEEDGRVLRLPTQNDSNTPLWQLRPT